jgi:hypothetical protein
MLYNILFGMYERRGSLGNQRIEDGHTIGLYLKEMHKNPVKQFNEDQNNFHSWIVVDVFATIRVI